MTTQHIPEWTMGDRLRKAREDAGLSQVELAERIGISRNTVSSAELGDRHPILVTLKAWAAETGVPLEWLQTGRLEPVAGPNGRRGRKAQSASSRSATALMQKRYSGQAHNPAHPLKSAA